MKNVITENKMTQEILTWFSPHLLHGGTHREWNVLDWIKKYKHNLMRSDKHYQRIRFMFRAKHDLQHFDYLKHVQDWPKGNQASPN